MPMIGSCRLDAGAGGTPIPLDSQMSPRDQSGNQSFRVLTRRYPYHIHIVNDRSIPPFALLTIA